MTDRPPESEFSFSYSRSGGKGGQNVNKVSTKVTLHWNVDVSPSFTPYEKVRLKGDPTLSSKISKSGDVVITEQGTRSQDMNRETLVRRLYEMIAYALRPIIHRKKTKPTRGSKERRIQGKKMRGEIKGMRGKVRE